MKNKTPNWDLYAVYDWDNKYKVAYYQISRYLPKKNRYQKILNYRSKAWFMKLIVYIGNKFGI